MYPYQLHERVSLDLSEFSQIHEWVLSDPYWKQTYKVKLVAVIVKKKLSFVCVCVCVCVVCVCERERDLSCVWEPFKFVWERNLMLCDRKINFLVLWQIKFKMQFCNLHHSGLSYFSSFHYP